MRWAIAVALAASVAQPAWSLSCMHPDITRDYAFAAASEDRYIVVKGNLVFDETLLPKRDADFSKRPQATTDIPAWFDGYSLTPEGFTRRFQRDVVLRVVCLGPWCGGTEQGEHLAFLKQEDTQFVMRLGPCPGMVYHEPTLELEKKVTACMTGNGCASESGTGQ
jgi:hypothetical protein